MESEHQYELRSRSRSRSQTPRVPSKSAAELELTEHHYDLRSRSRERSHTPGEVSSSRRSGSRSLTGSVTKRQDRSMETISERKEEPAVVADITAEAQNRQNESAASSAPKRVERRSERRRVKRQIFANGQSESKDESVDEKADESPTPRRVLTSDYSSEEGEREDSSRPGSAYEIYKQAGDWWNVFPKTDYTYSQKSQCRYEIAPGVLAMPNMSRRSIHSDSNSTTSSIPSTSQQNIDLSAQMTEDNFGKNNMDVGEITETSHTDLTPVERDLFEHTRLADSITRARVYKTTHFEQFKSHREVVYTDSGNSSPIESRQERYSTWTDFPSSAFVSRKFGRVSQIDSDTELDEAMTLTSADWKKKWNMRSWFRRLTVTIVMWYTRMVEFIGLRQSQVQRNLYTPSHDYRRYHESRWSKFWRFIDHALQYLYLLLVRILYLDSWLLSRASFVREGMQQRRSKILWITLLPLVLLAGWWCLPHICSATFHSITEALGQYSKESFTSEKSLPMEKLAGQLSMKEGELEPVIAMLSHRVKKIEDGITKKTEHSIDINQVIEKLTTSNRNEWKRYDEKLDALGKRLDEQGSYNSDFAAFKFEIQTLRELISQLSTCCNSPASAISGEEIEAHVDRVMTAYFGTERSKEDVTKIIQRLIIADNQVHTRESDTVKGPIEKRRARDVDSDASSTNHEGWIGRGLTKEDVLDLVKEALRIYDADKTGKVDYALESAGGQIISTRCTQQYNVKTRAFKLLGFTLYYEDNSPRTVIQGHPIQPGACWVFQDFPGYLLIKLRSFIHITGFTMEHAPRSILPNGEMKSAPRKFNVWGLIDENDSTPVLFGDYEFVDSDDNLQYFPVQNTSITSPYEYVELRIHSNHGQLEYTSLYRFRIHGRPV